MHHQRIFVHYAQRAKKKKKIKKKLFTPYKIIDSENFIKVSQNPNKVARDTQGLPTVPHNDFGGLNFKGLASKYLLLMTTSPYKVTFSKTNHEKNLLESEKTSDSALSGVVRIEIWSSFLFCVSSFCKSSRHVNEPACGILLYPKFEKDLGFCILVESLPYKGEVKNFGNEFL